MAWTKILNEDINFEVQLQSLPTKGNLVYEYNPFRNYRLSEDKFWYKNGYYTKEELKSEFKIIYLEKTNNWVKEETVLTSADEIPELHEKGELVDFITDELSFSLDHPVHIVPLYSYDGSVNLIINDGINTPRMINSRFSATGKNTYEIIDRKGNNDTNIYDSGDLFDIDTSLYKRVVKIPKLIYEGTASGGNLKVGNYHFYIKLSDADGNETDFVAESGLVSVFCGFGLPSSLYSGNKNENSYKNVKLYMSNIDPSYDYLCVYYSRYTAENTENAVTEYIKIDKKFVVSNAGTCHIVVTGFENTISITAADINLQYNIVDAACTSATCLNMLFLGNVHKPEIPYKELEDLSLRFLPYLHEERYDSEIDENYNISTTTYGYFDTKFIYEKTGYWNLEFYRLGVVYLMHNGELSPVFNIRGAIDITKYNSDEINYYHIPVYEDKSSERKYINYNESNFEIIQEEQKTSLLESTGEPIKRYFKHLNTKGVIKFSAETDTDTIYGIDIRISKEALDELKKYVKGYFFVRQPRIPTILAQGITIGIDQISNTPCIPTVGGMLDDLKNSLDYTHVETKDITDVNYISEGFLNRYTFKFKRKTSGLFSKILTAVAIGVAVVGVAAAAVFTAGAAAAAVFTAGAAAAGAAGLAGALSAGGAAIGTAAGTIGATVGLGAIGTVGTIAVTAGAVGAAAGLGVAVAGGLLEIRYAVIRTNKKPLNGKNTKTPSGYKIVELDDSRKITLDFYSRIIIKDNTNVKIQGIICPEYELNQPYFNLIFTGNTHKILPTRSLGINSSNEGFSGNYFNNAYRHFYIPKYYDTNLSSNYYDFKIIGIPDNVKLIGLDDLKFRSRAGEAEEVWRYLYVSNDYDLDNEYKKINTDIIRGAFGPYLAFNDYSNKLSPATTVNIYIPDYSLSNTESYIQIRMDDNSPFKAISDRIDINDLYKNNTALVNDNENSKELQHILYRGDCYICQFTHRLNRNFNDPSAPYNDEIVDANTWKDNYDPEKTEKYTEINLGDVNAVLLGMWVTFKVRSSSNLNIRTLDGSSVDECAMQGHDKGFFPYHPMSVEGTYKHADSYIYNKGFNVSLSERWNALVPDVPHIKNWFGTRIMYSDIHINDAYKNGYRVFLGTHYRDYTREYGEIVKLVPFESSLLCVFEHGIGLIPINERAVAGLGAGGNVYINTSNVLPENPKILSDMFGSQWPESVLKVPGISGDSPLYVYGVDTIAKKIWRTDGTRLECISDFKVQEFLNNNITLGERELTPKIGIRNVKTVYNAFKRDVMFTFYDNTYGFEEKVWNLCWNELLQKFTTFYSWVPSYMENINNIPFSFDRNVSKWIAKLGVSHTESSFADGITLSNVILTNYNIRNATTASAIYVSNLKYPFKYKTKTGEDKVIYLKVPEGKLSNLVGVLSLSNRVVPDVFHTIKYSIERDNYGNCRHFTIDTVDEIDLNSHSDTSSDSKYNGTVTIYGLYFTLQGSEEQVPVYYKNNEDLQVVRYMPDPNDKTKLLNVMMDSEKHDPESLLAELYYRNGAGNVYADVDSNKLGRLALECKSKAGTWIKDRNTISELYDKLDTESEAETIKIGFCKYLTDANGNIIYDNNGDAVPAGKVTQCTNLSEIESLIDTVNGLPYVHGIPLNWHWTMTDLNTEVDTIHFGLPIFKDLSGKRLQLPEKEQLNSDKLVTLLNIKATIYIPDEVNAASVSDTYYNSKAPYALGTNLIDAGYYESTIAIAPEWNLLFLTSDFWKHGQAGIIDITDPIKPTYWYGKLHPFEFEFLVVNDPSVHKIFDNLEIVANKAKPESFHYEIVGECYDFAKDKVNIYFRQEAMKALWLYNGADLCYDRNFLKVLPKQQPRSADLIRTYYARQDKINEVEDYYVQKDYPEESKYDYRHLTGAEIVYYPNRNEYRIWNHALAVDLDELSQDDARSIIGANCQYLEDKWRVQINPILICYKNEYNRRPSYLNGFALLTPTNSSWHNPNRPPLPVVNSPIPSLALSVIKNNHGEVLIPPLLSDMGYSSKVGIDTSSWLNDNNIYVTSFGEAQNRKELDLKDKFMKIRIRYSGEDLAIINFINTIYRVSFS